MEQSEHRKKIIERIKQYEAEGKWDVDVEDDPPTIPLLPNKVDYLNKKLWSKICTKVGNSMAQAYFEKQIKKRQLIIKEIIGIENFKAVSGGAILTCNHFNPADNYAVYRAIRDEMGKKLLYKIIREGNYTNFPGIVGFFFRHCNTLPLSSNTDTMKKFLSSLKVLLNRGEKVLIYPEQAMWWNYRKPRPLKDGAFNFAISNNVPVIPVFITMEDSDVMDPDGFPVQEYTIHFLSPLYADENLTKKQNIQIMKQKNFDMWKEVYENTYKIPLEYKN